MANIIDYPERDAEKVSKLESLKRFFGKKKKDDAGSPSPPNNAQSKRQSNAPRRPVGVVAEVEDEDASMPLASTKVNLSLHPTAQGTIVVESLRPPELRAESSSSAGSLTARRDKRFRYHLPITVSRGGQEDERVLTHDVSFRGLFVRHDNPPPMRQLIRMSMFLPSTEYQIVLHGMVVHVVKPDNPYGKIPGFGICLYAVDRDTRAAWDTFVRYIDEQQTKFPNDARSFGVLPVPVADDVPTESATPYPKASNDFSLSAVVTPPVAHANTDISAASVANTDEKMQLQADDFATFNLAALSHEVDTLSAALNIDAAVGNPLYTPDHTSPIHVIDETDSDLLSMLEELSPAGVVAESSDRLFSETHIPTLQPLEPLEPLGALEHVEPLELVAYTEYAEHAAESLAAFTAAPTTTDWEEPTSPNIAFDSQSLEQAKRILARAEASNEDQPTVEPAADSDNKDSEDFSLASTPPSSPPSFSFAVSAKTPPRDEHIEDPMQITHLAHTSTVDAVPSAVNSSAANASAAPNVVPLEAQQRAQKKKKEAALQRYGDEDFIEPIRRAYPRYHIEVKVQLETINELFELYSQDISQGGMFLPCELKLSVGSRVRVHLQHPVTNVTYPLDAVVRRVGATVHRNTDKRGLAVEFTPISSQQQIDLYDFIHSQVSVTIGDCIFIDATDPDLE